jgi:hypothetical protein
MMRVIAGTLISTVMQPLYGRNGRHDVIDCCLERDFQARYKKILQTKSWWDSFLLLELNAMQRQVGHYCVKCY